MTNELDYAPPTAREPRLLRPTLCVALSSAIAATGLAWFEMGMREMDWAFLLLPCAPFGLLGAIVFTMRSDRVAMTVLFAASIAAACVVLEEVHDHFVNPNRNTVRILIAPVVFQIGIYVPAGLVASILHVARHSP